MDDCEYAMIYAKKDDKESIRRIHESMLKYRKNPDNKGTVKLLATVR